jgi:hypothetical protein
MLSNLTNTFVPGQRRDYCMFADPWSAGDGAMVTGAVVTDLLHL